MKWLAGIAVVLCLGACAASDDSASDATTTTAPVLPDGACVARMKDPNPGTGGTDTALIDSHFGGVPVIVVAHYKSTDSTYSGSINANKHGEVEFSIGKPTAGYPVGVDVTVRGADANEKCQTSFTPH
ncbi:MAG TPA: hypothetical protein VFB78_13970 [Acidimicrobiales bacterium]|nr:hypothetical protein [Acidimicrobiales bacterium]